MYEYISDLGEKLDVIVRALRLGTKAAVARSIGIAPSTLAGYQTGGVNTVPKDHVDAIADLIAERLHGRMTKEQARTAFCSDVEILQFAVAPYSSSAFENLLDEAKPTVSIRICRRGPGDGLGMIDDEPPDRDVERVPFEARFRLEIDGPRNSSGSFVVVLARSLLGWYFAIPRTSEAVKIGENGSVRAPKTALRFPIGGLWTFHAFLVQSAVVPTLIVRKDYTARISNNDLDTFALQLRDRIRTRTFLFGRRAVFVDARNKPAASAASAGSAGQ